MKRPKKGVIEKYYKALNAIEKEFKNTSNYAVSNVLKENGLNTGNVKALQDLGIIQKTNRGTKWVGSNPSFEMALAVRNRFTENRMTRIANKSKKQPTFEWAKPETTVKIEPKYEYNIQPDSTAVSEFIDHHEQSLLPPPTKRVKTAKNNVKERMFQLRIFGINLFTVKY